MSLIEDIVDGDHAAGKRKKRRDILSMENIKPIPAFHKRDIDSQSKKRRFEKILTECVGVRHGQLIFGGQPRKSILVVEINKVIVLFIQYKQLRDDIDQIGAAALIFAAQEMEVDPDLFFQVFPR
jgi:hypothetical protein